MTRPTIRIPIETLNGQTKPEYKTEEAAGADICAPCDIDLTDECPVVKLELDFKTRIPKGRVAVLVPRGSIGNAGLALANTVGIIDSDFPGVWKAKVFKHYWADDIHIKKGERFLQLVIVKHEHAAFFRKEVLQSTSRGHEGGSTGRS